MTRSRIQTRVDAQLKAKLKALAESRKLNMNDILEEALHEYLNPDDYKTVSLAYLSGLEKRHALVLKRLDMLLEMYGKFILVWFMSTPEIENEPLKRAMAHSGNARYNKFFDKISKSMNADSVLRAFETRIIAEDDFDDGGKA